MNQDSRITNHESRYFINKKEVMKIILDKF
jgi:hypothetical protein